MLRFKNGKLAITDGVAIAFPDGFWVKETWEEGLLVLSPDKKSTVEFSLCDTETLLEDAQTESDMNGDVFEGPIDVTYSKLKGFALLYTKKHTQYSVYLDIGKGYEMLEVLVHSDDLKAYIAGKEFCALMDGIEVEG